jgi:hypothetical protein
MDIWKVMDQNRPLSKGEAWAAVGALWAGCVAGLGWTLGPKVPAHSPECSPEVGVGVNNYVLMSECIRKIII